MHVLSFTADCQTGLQSTMSYFVKCNKLLCRQFLKEFLFHHILPETLYDLSLLSLVVSSPPHKPPPYFIRGETPITDILQNFDPLAP